MNARDSVEKHGATRQIVTVSELNRSVATMLEQNFPLLWVAGEISNLTRASSGHWYFSLKDRDAQVRCVMFRGRNQHVDWPLREGDQIEARVLVGLYAPRGDFQLNVEAMRKAGAGSLFEAFTKLKQKLQAEGLFDAERKRALPSFVRSIGIVTSLQAAALRDVVTTIQRRAPHVRVVIYPTPVQGRDAAFSLTLAIGRASIRARTLGETDVVLLVRGGGSIEDLWAFNDEALARAIVASHVPVISGVGHETDFTIADFAADLRAPTPTAAAELASGDGAALRRELNSAAATIRRLTQRRLEFFGQRVDDAQRRLRSPLQQWAGARDRLAASALHLERSHAMQFARVTARVEAVASALYRNAPDVALRIARVAGLEERMKRHVGQSLLARSTRIELQRARLELLNPHAALDRGYAIATDETGAVVRDATKLKVGSAVHLMLARGGAVTRVEQIEPAAP